MAFINLKKLNLPLKIEKEFNRSQERASETSGEKQNLSVEIPLFSFLQQVSASDHVSEENALLLERLESSVESLLNEAQSELRLDFSSQFTLFLKMKQDGSKLLVAHPEEDEWVATAILSKDQMEEFLKHLHEKRSISFEDLGRFSKMSNLRLRFV